MIFNHLIIQPIQPLCQYLDFVLVLDTATLAYCHIPPLKLLQEIVEMYVDSISFRMVALLTDLEHATDCSLNKQFKRRTKMILVLGVGWFVLQSYNMVSYAVSDATKKKIQFIPDGKYFITVYIIIYSGS